MDSRLIDGTGAPIRDGIRWREAGWGVCTAPGCDVIATLFGWLPYVGTLGYVCSEHRADRAVLDALIIAVTERGKARARTNDTAADSP